MPSREPASRRNEASAITINKSAMPAASNREEFFELELSSERSTLSPAAAWSPTGHPPSRDGARGGGVCFGVPLCAGGEE
jgi:hypothetical protein